MLIQLYMHCFSTHYFLVPVAEDVVFERRWTGRRLDYLV